MGDPYELSDLIRRVRNMVRNGVVHSVQVSPPRCRVTFGADPITQKEHVTDWLAWGLRADAERQDWSMPAVGAPVTVLSEGGDLRLGVVYPGGITDDQTPASDSLSTHVIRFGNGARFSYDTASNRADISLPAGGTITITGPGGIELAGDTIITGSLRVTEDADVEGSIRAEGDITDKGGDSGSMQDLRETYNLHDHDYNDGTTAPPNQPV